MSVDAARKRIAEIDGELVALAAERIKVARALGQAKAAQGRPTVDFAQERAVLENVRAQAARQGVPQAVAEEMAVRLIMACVAAQEGDRIVASAPGKGGTAVVVGGAGRMGTWLCRFLSDSGYQVLVVDKARKPDENEAGHSALPRADLVLLAVAPLEVARLYREWAAAPPKGVVADLCSVKSPILHALRALQAAGGHVASFHPLFGPGLTVLRDAEVVLCGTGDEAAAGVIRGLFAPTTARVVELALDEHDKRMAEVLSLAHATALSYAAALSPESPGLHSTTAKRLQAVADSVVRESPQVYYEIQVGNPHSEAALARLQAAVARLRRVVHARDYGSFQGFMEQGRQHLDARQANEISPNPAEPIP